MWEGDMSTSDIAHARMEFTLADAKRIDTAPKQAGPNTRSGEKNEMNKVLPERVVELALKHWGAPSVFVQKLDGTLHLFGN